ncbi:MAG: rhodanese-like domain-containing protein [Ghiorsea sp.]
MQWLEANLVTVIIFAVIAWMVWGRVVRPKLLGIQKMTADKYADFQSEPHTLIDVRSAGEWNGGRASNAIHIPLNEVTQRMNKIPKDKPVVLICASGMRSSMAAVKLAKAGYEPVYNFAGGMGSWCAAKLPTKA